MVSRILSESFSIVGDRGGHFMLTGVVVDILLETVEKLVRS
jgi:hypothetical protein